MGSPVAACKAYRLGLIVNPIAGMGGSVGLKGTDGSLAARARALGARPQAADRAAAALAALDRDRVVVLTAAAAMGETVARDAGFDVEVVYDKAAGESAESTGRDTQLAVAAIDAAAPDLTLFVGGDGTARDVLAAFVGRSGSAVLGVPAGVKMHSAVFAASPRAAGDIAGRYLEAADRERLLVDAEVLDREFDEQGRPASSPQLHGTLRVPSVPMLKPGAKAASRTSEAAQLAGALDRVAADTNDACISLIGPGSTMLALKRRFGFDGTPLGVDAVQSGKAIAMDLSAQEILELARDGRLRIVVTVVGGQGFLFGRGNQQFSPAVIRAAGMDGIVIVASTDKLAGLPDQCLYVDTGDPDLDAELAGYRPVRVSEQRIVMMPVRATSAPPGADAAS